MQVAISGTEPHKWTRRIGIHRYGMTPSRPRLISSYAASGSLMHENAGIVEEVKWWSQFTFSTIEVVTCITPTN